MTAYYLVALKVSPKVKRNLLICLFIALILLNTLLRIGVLGDPLTSFHTDWARDYIIGHHIVKYGEIPLTAPQSGPLGMFLGNPFYFYFTALQLLIKDDIMFLGWMNILLQVTTLVVVFLFASSMFGRATAFIVLVLFGFSQSVIDQSRVVWQPYTMEPFINVSFLLAFLSYKKKNFLLLALGVIFFLIGFSVHASAFALTPVYLVVIYLILRKNFRSMKYFLTLAATVFVAIFLLYAPKVYFDLFVDKTPSASTFNLVSILTSQNKTVFEFFSHTWSRTQVLFGYFMVTEKMKTVILFIVGTAVAGLLVSLRRNGDKRLYFITLMVALLLFIIASGIYNPATPPNPPTPRYFQPIFGIFCIILAYIINFLFPQKGFYLVPKIIIVVILVSTFSPHLISNVQSAFSSPLFVPRQRSAALEAVEMELASIKNVEHRENFNFFQLREYRVLNEDNSLFLAYLENDLHTKLVETDDFAFRDYRQISDPAYMFVICPNPRDEIWEEECPQVFFQESPNYFLIREIYSQYPYQIFLAKRVL